MTIYNVELWRIVANCSELWRVVASCGDIKVRCYPLGPPYICRAALYTSPSGVAQAAKSVSHAVFKWLRPRGKICLFSFHHGNHPVSETWGIMSDHSVSEKWRMPLTMMDAIESSNNEGVVRITKTWSKSIVSTTDETDAIVFSMAPSQSNVSATEMPIVAYKTATVNPRASGATSHWPACTHGRVATRGQTCVQTTWRSDVACVVLDHPL